ncbi:MAG: response regulator transcription factor [Thermodesulfobacteriota bacterium]|nr:response regulator transcription factor [Thermodesulfobacteriota bacterium]
MPATNILIADDHRVVIEGIKSALQEHPEFEVVGEAVDGLEAVEFAKSLKPNIVIMDISMPNLSGIEATRQIKALNPGNQIVIYTMHSDKEFVIDLFKAGISAYVLKDDPLSDLILALKAVEGGGTYFSTMAPTILARHMEEMEEKTTSKNSFDTLSQREMEVFQLLAEGKRIKEIANQLFISPKTVESHKYNIMEKLQAASVIDLTKIAIRKNLIKV